MNLIYVEKVVISKSELERLYISEQKSIREICKETGHDLKTIIKLFREHGIVSRDCFESWRVRRNNLTAHISKELLLDLYCNQRLSIINVAKKLGVSKKLLRSVMVEYAIPFMTKSQSLVGKKKSEEHRLKILAVPRPTKDTSIERLVEEGLAEKEVAHYKHYPILGCCQSDKAFPDEKIAVFCDGDYWHSIPKAVENDKRVNKILEENGWIVLRFTEKEIKANPGIVVSKIINTLLTRRYLLNGI